MYRDFQSFNVNLKVQNYFRRTLATSLKCDYNCIGTTWCYVLIIHGVKNTQLCIVLRFWKNKRKHTYTTTNNLHDKVECCKKHQKTFREKLFKFHPSLYTNYVFNLTFKPPNFTIMFSTTSWQKNKTIRNLTYKMSKTLYILMISVFTLVSCKN